MLADGTDLPVWIMENGICNRVIDGVAHPRLDGWTRSRYLAEHLAALARAVMAGVPIEAYLHWTLYDNWEWGSYEPRFGLYATERPSGRRLADGRDGATPRASTATPSRRCAAKRPAGSG